jgi:hypothetical protein
LRTISEIFRWTPRLFEKAAASDWFEDSKVELLGGIVFELTANPPHMIAVLRHVDARKVLAPEPGWVVTKEDNVQLGRWPPLSDRAILRGPIDRFRDRLPAARDILQP